MKPLNTLKLAEKKGEKQMPKKKPLVYPVVFMILITVFFTSILAIINANTIDLINQQEALNIQRSILYVFDIPFDTDDGEAVSRLYNDNIKMVEENNRQIFSYYLENKLVGHAFEFDGTGLWGTITGHAALSPSFDRLLGINFIAHSETPGLGGRIDEEVYKEQFRNLVPANPDSAVIYSPAPSANVDAITGATLTSNSVRDMLNTFLPEIINFAKEVGIYESN